MALQATTLCACAFHTFSEMNVAVKVPALAPLLTPVVTRAYDVYDASLLVASTTRGGLGRNASSQAAASRSRARARLRSFCFRARRLRPPWRGMGFIA